MLAGRFINVFINAEPVTNGCDLAKWNASLCHAKGAWIHPQKKNPACRFRIPCQIRMVRFPSILQGVVDVCDWRLKTEFINGMAQLLG
jgi:hypothetical protein